MKTIKYLLFISTSLLLTYLSFQISYHSIMAEKYQFQTYNESFIYNKLTGFFNIEEHNNSELKYFYHYSQVRNKSWLFSSLLVILILITMFVMYTQQTNFTRGKRVKLIQWLMFICILLLIPSLFAPFLRVDESIHFSEWESILFIIKGHSIELTIRQLSRTNTFFCLILIVCCLVIPGLKVIHTYIATTKHKTNDTKRKIFKIFEKFPKFTIKWAIADCVVVTLLPTLIILYGKNIDQYILDFGFYFYTAYCMLAFCCIFLINIDTKDGLLSCNSYDPSVECNNDTREKDIVPKKHQFSSAKVLKYLQNKRFSFFKTFKKRTKRNFSCTLFCPPKVNKAEVFFIQIFIHFQNQFSEAKKAAYNFDEKTIRKGNVLLNKIRKGDKLAFHLYIENIELVDPIKMLKWNEITDSVIFEINIPKNFSSKCLIGKVSIMSIANSMFIGHINFKLNVINDDSYQIYHNPVYNASAKWYQYIFISYARKDIKEVMKRVQMINLLKYKYFQDIYYLQPGDKWKHEVLKNIESSDAFFLFWSSAAKNSMWVKKEINHALNVKKGIDNNPPEIVPVIIEQPVPSPPDELKHIHFNDCISLLTI